LQLIKRDIPDWETKPHQPKDPNNWWRVYRKLKEQTQKDREQGAEKLKAALDSIKDEREQNLAKVVARKDLPKEPTNYRARTLHNYNSGKTGSKSGHRLSLLEKIRKEAREARLARINAPTSQLVKKPSEIKKAPQGLVEDFKRAAQQKASMSVAVGSPSAPRIPRPPLAVTRQQKPAIDKSFLEREDRLRALTGGRPREGTATIDPSSRRTDQQSQRPTTSQPLLKRKPHLAQSDGANEEDVQDKQLSDTDSGTQSRPIHGIQSTPLHRTGTPPVSRFGSPGPPPKRKAEPSIFMSAKKSKAGR
jgi:RNA polymerase II transcription factor SIII (Elongin) subunit A